MSGAYTYGSPALLFLTSASGMEAGPFALLAVWMEETGAQFVAWPTDLADHRRTDS